MAEAYKCDVVACGKFSEGSVDGKFISHGESRSMCKKHTDALKESYFPDLISKPAEPVPPTPPAPSESQTPSTT